MKEQNQSSDDHVALLLAFLAIAVITALATSVTFIVASLVLLAAWFFGGLKRVAFISLCLIPIATLFAFHNGGTLGFIQTISRGYAADVHQPDYLIAPAYRWLTLAFENQAWISTSPIGLFAGAALLLWYEDYKNSPAYKVFTEPTRPQPAPWASLLTWYTLQFPSFFRNRITIGAEISTGKRVSITTGELKRHIITVGRSGRGKSETTFTISVQAAARLGIPIVYIDGKNDPEVKQKLIELANACKRKIYVFDSMDPDNSCAYDAFSNKNITTQKDMVIALRPKWTEPHYKAFAGRFAQTTFKVMDYAKVRVDLTTFLNALSVNALLSLAKRGADKTGRYNEIQKEIIGLREIEKQATESIRSEVTELTNAHFGIAFDTGEALRTGRPILNLLRAREEGSIAYIGIPGLTFPEAGSKLVALFNGDLKATLPAGTGLWLIIFDEFSIFANPQTLNLINMGRSFGGACILSTQSFADFLTEESQSFLRQVVGSANTFVIHELTDPQDAELAAQIFGTTFSVEFTSQIVNNQLTGNASARATQEFKVHPNEIKSLGVGEALILNKDHPKIIRHTKIKLSEPRG